ncbi:hypothetical protein GH714_005342 [Hevea brasiliensis]|uniref:inositol-1,3,4-trisphosphate 5/6-kinase n=1 Tax=Hevea brasiliensis TaxID=3981 RepID=A0A6A6KHM5_HEVBR|nr:hypothetical protein GH714_005342 [Hevea brasiliensis]
MSGRDHVVWTNEMDNMLTNAMLEEDHKGNRPEGTWNTRAFNNMIQERSEARKWMHTPINNYDMVIKELQASAGYAHSLCSRFLLIPLQCTVHSAHNPQKRNSTEGEMVTSVGGVILDESVLIDNSGTAALRPEALSLLRKLRHSNLHLAISYSPALSNDKVSLLKKMAMQYSFDCFIFDGSSMDDALKVVTLAWGDIGGTILYLVSNHKTDCFNQLSNLGWIIVVLDAEVSAAFDNSTVLCINKLEELLLTICHLNIKANGNNVVTVGYVMKPSREEDFAKRGAFPISSTPNGLIFLPLTFEVPLRSQLQHVDIVLHKATDEIISVELSDSAESSSKITYTTGMQELRRYMENHSDCFVIDPLDKIYPVLDRLKIQQILLGLEDINAEGRHTIRGPHFLKVNNFNEPDLVLRLSEAKLFLPSIVKPQIACGVADAHSMAIVFRVEDFKDLGVPLPAVVQEKYLEAS